MLITSHIDKPGVIGEVGTLLGNNNINIAGMNVGRDQVRGGAGNGARAGRSYSRCGFGGNPRDRRDFGGDGCRAVTLQILSVCSAATEVGLPSAC